MLLQMKLLDLWVKINLTFLEHTHTHQCIHLFDLSHQHVTWIFCDESKNDLNMMFGVINKPEPASESK